MAKAATINGMWIGKSVDRAIEEARQTMTANECWGEYNDMAMKRTYENAARRMAQLQAARAA
jgi:hypothetical protein